MDQMSKEDSSKKQATDDEILALAKKELLRDVKCASLRAEQFGAHSWAKPQNYVPSKRFLKNLLVSASSHNDRREYLTEKRRKHAKRTYDSIETSCYPESDKKEKHLSSRSKKDLYYSKERKTEKDLNLKERKSEKDIVFKRQRSKKKKDDSR